MVLIQLIICSLSVLLVCLQNQVYGDATNQFFCQIEINYWPQYIFVLSTHSQQQWCFCCRRLSNETQYWKKQLLLFFVVDGRTFKCSSAKSIEFFFNVSIIVFLHTHTWKQQSRNFLLSKPFDHFSKNHVFTIFNSLWILRFQKQQTFKWWGARVSTIIHISKQGIAS